MLVLGLASSFAPAMFREPSEWPKIHQWLTGAAPQPGELGGETAEIIQQHAVRIRAGFKTLSEKLEESKIDALIALAADNGRVFTRVQVPQFATYLGEEIWGSTRFAELGEKAEEDIVRLRCASELAGFLHKELVLSGFDLNYVKTLRPLGQPEFGAPPAFACPPRFLVPNLDIPVVPIFVNSHAAPAPSGHRCHTFGTAMAQILQERPERIAIFACGGLSHDHNGPRAGWIDAPLDQWVLEQLSRGKCARLREMFDLDSDTLRGGTAEIRLWIVVAAACESLGAKAGVIDYLPSYSAATGIGFAYWPLQEGSK
jgi:protocatechuate 4,5-dioxygenase beta chain